ncbi:unnamed protein product, partial [Didymodactylos carnosus]
MSIIQRTYSPQCTEPSKNIKSTIALLDKTTHEWQIKHKNLKDQLSRNETLLRSYKKEIQRYQHLLHEAGLIQPVRKRRYSSSDIDNPPTIDFRKSIVHQNNDYLLNHYGNTNQVDVLHDHISALKNIVQSHRKYIQQLQTRVRINAPDIIHSSTTLEKETEKLIDVNKQLESTNNAYKTELELVKDEFKKLYQNFEHYRTQLNEYSTVIDVQRKQNENLTARLTNSYHILKKCGVRSPVLTDLFDTELLQKNQSTKDLTEERIDNFSIDLITSDERWQPKQQTSLVVRDTTVDNKERQIQELSRQLSSANLQLRDSKATIEQIDAQYRQQISDLKSKFESNSSKYQFEELQEHNQRLSVETKSLRSEINNYKILVERYKQQVSILENRVQTMNVSTGAGEITIRTTEMTELLNEMRHLRTDLERSIKKQTDLQVILDESMKQSRTTREFTFQGKGISYPDLRILDGSLIYGDTQRLSLVAVDNRRIRPIGSSTTEISEIERYHGQEMLPGKMYIVGEIEDHSTLRQIISDIKTELKSIESDINDKSTLRQCLQRLDDCYRIIDLYWKAYLPVKDSNDEHHFTDQTFGNENTEYKRVITKSSNDSQRSKQRRREQTSYNKEVLSHLV